MREMRIFVQINKSKCFEPYSTFYKADQKS